MYIALIALGVSFILLSLLIVDCSVQGVMLKTAFVIASTIIFYIVSIHYKLYPSIYKVIGLI